MVVDIAPQPQLNEVFTTNRTHHRSSSSTHRRNSATTNNTSSSGSNTTNNTTMTNGHRFSTDELSRKAVQILGQATAILGCRRQTSIDFHGHAPRLNITESKSNVSSRNSTSNTASSTIVHNSSTITTFSQSANNSVSSIHKGRSPVAAERLVPLILQLVAAPILMKFPERISRHQSNSKSVDDVLESRKMALVSHREGVVNLSDDENDEDDNNNDHDGDDDNDENQNHNEKTFTVLTELTDTNTTSNNSKNQNNSNDNRSYHSYENQIELQHSGIIHSRYEDNEDSEDEDSDNQEATHSDAENDDETNETNANTLSLMDFVRGKETLSEPVDSSLLHSSESLSTVRKRSISPEVKPDHDNHVHKSEEHQNKRKKLLIKRALLKSFVSSVNTKINFKRPSLPITIPTHLFLDQEEQSIERSQRISKRYANGSLKHDNNTDVLDGLSQNSLSSSSSSSSSSSMNNQLPTTHGAHQKKNKTSHVQDKTLSKQEPSTLTSTTIVKNEQISTANNTTSSNDLDSKTRTSVLSTTNTATISPMLSTQPKKEKPTANVKPLLQSAPFENSSVNNSLGNGINTSDGLPTTNTRSMHSSTRSSYTKFKNLSKAELASLARRKKKQADHGKRTTFAEAREAMGLYLESVCYFIQCANDETKQDQRTSLLATTLTMLSQLAQNHKKMFYLTNPSQSTDLYNLQQKFLLINYWLQSLIYYLQFNTNMPTIDRYATQVTEYLNQSKNPSSTAPPPPPPPPASTRTTTTTTTTTTNPNLQQQSTPNNDNNPISPLSTTSQTSLSDLSTTSGNNQTEQHRSMCEFSKLMLNSYHSTYYWNKAESLSCERSLKEFTEQLLRQNQNRRLSRDDTTLDFILYIFDAIELLRLSVA
ncbi:unnamed protein product [Adineta ricciae]|uniref:Uncharacterized protein n=1 Tax=Adineta ricciae TaxID=249248 RepID=A0A815IBG0_ADIRI|nr:unnamed protein product [Adineta ricciae]